MGIDAAGESQQHIDRAGDQEARGRVLPERHADERAAGGEDERRRQREDREHVGEHARSVRGDDDVAHEVRRDEHGRDGLPSRVRVLLARRERSGRRVRHRIQRESQPEPRHHQDDARPQSGGRVERARGEEHGCEPGYERELAESEQPDADHLAGHEMAGLDRRDDELDDPVLLLLDHPGQHPRAIDGERDDHGNRPDHRHEDLGVGGLAASGDERDRCQLRRRRQVPANRADGGVGDRGQLGVDGGAEDEPVGGKDDQRIRALRLERPPAGGGRRDERDVDLRVERRRRALERRRQPGRSGPRDGDVIGRVRVDDRAERCGCTDDEQEEPGGVEERTASQPLADLTPGDEDDRAPAAHGSTSSRKSSASEGGP